MVAAFLDCLQPLILGANVNSRTRAADGPHEAIREFYYCLLYVKVAGTQGSQGPGFTAGDLNPNKKQTALYYTGVL